MCSPTDACRVSWWTEFEALSGKWRVPLTDVLSGRSPLRRRMDQTLAYVFLNNFDGRRWPYRQQQGRVAQTGRSPVHWPELGVPSGGPAWLSVRSGKGRAH
ncbi:hypothetical protein NDU88_002841 [Pleurodeles waltl]|uniref:Uncharacterized protein n=1 Tax=Pleurodeles waltl TaxID=8319 RepID=A0AAV7Q843_PLEWA|nr:hypothetical protein NDU88_002841 [Pleurodeles waltl]